MGGIQASSGEFPYVVSVMYNGQHHCGGFIYNLQWVITAASCVYGYAFKAWHVNNKSKSLEWLRNTITISFFLRNVRRKYPSQLKVTVGQLSLNNVDPGEEIINVFSFRTFNAYDPVTKSNDIAMIEVR